MLATQQRQIQRQKEKRREKVRAEWWHGHTFVFREVFHSCGVQGGQLVGHLSQGGGKYDNSTKWSNEEKDEANMVGIQKSPTWLNACTAMTKHLSASAYPQQTDCVSGMHIDYPSTNAVNCHGEWRRATEQERERVREHRGLDSAIYKAWPSACLINCALFWESRKPAGLQERGRQSKRRRKKYIYIALWFLFLLFPVFPFLLTFKAFGFHRHLSFTGDRRV